MQEHVAGPAVGLGAGPVPISRGLAQDPVPAAVGDAALLLDIHVDEVTGVLVFIAADGAPGGPVLPFEFGQPVARKHAVDRGGLDSEAVSDPVRSPPLVHAQADDAPFALHRYPVR